MLRQNRWRACRFGLDAELVDPDTLEALPARQAAEALIRRLGELAGFLDCRRHLDHALEMTVRPTGSERQLILYEKVGDLAEVVRRLTRQSRLSVDPAQVATSRLATPASTGKPGAGRPRRYAHSFRPVSPRS